MLNSEIIRAYLVCALWSSTGDDGEPISDTHSMDDLSESANLRASELVSDFLGLLEREGIDWCMYWSAGQLGNDLWLTQNGHGAGFWDRYSLNNNDGYIMGQSLTKWAKTLGSVELYVSDNGLIYFE